MITPKIDAAISVLLALADAIRLLGRVPSGELYAYVMGSIDLATYESLIDKLVGSGLVTRENHLLIWQGKEKP